MLGLIGKKLGMTQLFVEDGSVVPVTAIEAGPCPVVQVKTGERDGYRAVQLGFGQRKPSRSRKPGLGHAARAGLDFEPQVTREFRLSATDVIADDPHVPAKREAAGAGGEEAPESAAVSEDRAGEQASELRVGARLTVAMFKEGERVKVSGRSKGRGFQGVVKRHGFRGRPKTHGHPSIRVPGSVGPGTDPSRVIKGRKMAGHMGTDRQTVRNLQVVRVDLERNLLYVRGSVPGSRNGWVYVSKQ
ncbi:MAG: 50S ribosomal protein L3 [Gemmatimonadota bacterium]|nr:MAG: 50S ribosomal protein L3 [Gemmatimonadota bacterium]